jgi:1,4-dihydroxy-2-naphthoyl-CoA hydrolase
MPSANRAKVRAMNSPTHSFGPELTPEMFNGRSRGHLPGLLGLSILSVTPEAVESRLEVRQEVMAPNGFLHAASVIALADTSCGYGCVVHLPKGAIGFTTIELKSNFLGTARDGAIHCRATPVHLGRTTQVWDALVSVEGSASKIALFRCTQMVLWPKQADLPTRSTV